MEKKGFVYIITNKPYWTLYIWVTANLEKRILEHKNKIYDWFSAKYDLNKLVWFVELPTIIEAITLEKQIKSRNRKYKIQLIESMNNSRRDLSES